MKNYGLSKRLKSILAVLLCFALLSGSFGIIALAYNGDDEEDDPYYTPCAVHYFVNGVCRDCEKHLCEVTGGHQFEDDICIYCGRYNCSFTYQHVYEDGVCILCKKHECEITGSHQFKGNVCTLCGKYECELSGHHDYIGNNCIFCGKYECENTGNHNYGFAGVYCYTCGKHKCEITGFHQYEGYVCTLCGRYECEIINEHDYLNGCCIYCGKYECEITGEHQYENGICTVCGAEDPNANPSTGTCTHNFVGGVCTICGAVDPGIITPVSCPPHNFINGVCTYCGKTWCEINGHDYEEGVCKYCGKTECGVTGHNFENAVCTVCGKYRCEVTGVHYYDEEGVCEYCGKTECEVTGHDFKNGVCTRCDALEAELAAHNLSLEGDIGVNFYVTVPGATEDTYAKFTFRGKTTQVPVDLDKYENYNGDKAYRFSFAVAAADIDEPVTCVVVNGPYRSEAYTYSVNQYIDETAVLDNDELRDLMGALGDYGYYANCFFNPGSPFEKAIVSNYESKMDLMTAESLAGFNGADLPSGAGNALTYEGMTLVLRSETAIRYYFTLPEGADTGDYTFKSVAPDDSETQLTPVKKGSMYYVEISDIPSALLGQMYIVQVYAGEELVNFYAGCALTYAYRVISAPGGMSEELVTLCKALAYYEDCARRYFAG